MKLLLTVPPKSIRPWLTSKGLMKPEPFSVPVALALVSVPPLMAPPAAILIVPLLAQAGITFNTPVPATLMPLPACVVGALAIVKVPPLAVTNPEFTTKFEIVPKPLILSPPLFVTVPPASTPPLICKEPPLSHAGLTVSVLAATFIVPLLTGATVSVALLFRLKLPALTNALLIAPWKNIALTFVTGPLKNVLAVTAIVAALLTPPLTVAPATALVSTPVPPSTIISPLESVCPFRLNVPPLINAVLVMVAVLFSVTVPLPALTSLLLVVPCE